MTPCPCAARDASRNVADSIAIIDAMHRVYDAVFGLYELLRMAARSGFRIHIPYWKWRYETAFGTNAARRPSRLAQFRAMIEYGAWVHRMRRRYGP